MKPQDDFRQARTDAGTIVHRFHTAWNTARQAAGRALRSRWLRAGGLALVLLVVAGSVSYERYLASSNRPLEAYPLLSLEGYHRLLVFAPHCDDEALGAGGLIQAALRQGLNVHVVVVTAGDGYRNAAMVESRRPILRPEDYVKLAERRQQESLNALTILGLGAGDVTFLGYPERSLVTLWWEHWSSEYPYRSPFTKRERIEYPRVFRPNAPRSGEALLDALRTILAAERPDLIVLPHPNDPHPDHAALSAFILLALEMERAAEPDLAPQLLGYLIHYGALYPQPYGLRPEASLRPPYGPERLWVAEVAGNVVGYVMGCGDSRRRMRISFTRILPAALRGILQRRYHIGEKTLRYALRSLQEYLEHSIPAIPLDQFPGHLHINVAASARRQGIGRTLLETSLAQFWTTGTCGVHVFTTDRNRVACHLHESLGFRLLDARPTRRWRGLVAGSVQNRVYGINKPPA